MVTRYTSHLHSSYLIYYEISISLLRIDCKAHEELTLSLYVLYLRFGESGLGNVYRDK